MISQFHRSVTIIRPYLSFRSFDISTAEGRARERQRRALLSTVVAMGAKIVSIGTQLITVPVTLSYLGTERFGLWMTISSVIAMLAFADLGIGNGLLNAVAKATGEDDNNAIRRYISSAALILSLVSIFLLTAFGLAYSHIAWDKFFNIHSPAAIAEAGPAAAAFVLCFAFNIPATIVQRAQLGLQMGFVANLWQVLGSLLALIAVLTVVHLHGGLQWLVFAFAGTPVIAAVVNGILFFGKSRPDLCPNLAAATSGSALEIMRIGLLFFVLQIVVSVTYLSDNVVIAHVLGASAVTIYALPDKMFSVIPMILTMMLTPLWPAYGEAIARRDEAWVRRILKKTLLVSLSISAVLSIAFFSFGEKILSLWTGREINIPVALLLGMAVWKIIEALGNTIAVYLNGHGLIREQVLMSVMTGISAIFGKFYLVQNYGVAGAVWATIASYLIFSVVPLYLLVSRTFKVQTV